VSRLDGRVRRRALRYALRVAVRRRAHDDLVRLGSSYGGWWVPRSVLGSRAVAISVGVGEDTTFDEELLRHGCEVWAFDPTPRAAAHVDRACAAGLLGSRFHFFRVGVWHEDNCLRFYAPADPTHVSHSLVNIQRTSTWFEADVWSLTRAVAQTGRPTPDVLKMDIEGAEVAVVRHMLAGAVRPAALCLELDAPLPASRNLSLIRELRRANYRLAHLEGWNVLFLHKATYGP